jgi:hypothetical protein
MRQVLLTDTVGFIQKLPTKLVASFRATLVSPTPPPIQPRSLTPSRAQYAAATIATIATAIDATRTRVHPRAALCLGAGGSHPPQHPSE